MNCRKCKNLFSAYLDNDIKSGERRRFEDHLAGCDECAKEFADFKAVVGLTVDLPMLQPSADFDKVLRIKLANSDVRKETGWFIDYRSAAVIGMVCLLLALALGAYIYKARYTDRQSENKNVQIAVGREVIPMVSSHLGDGILTNFVMPSVPNIPAGEWGLGDMDVTISGDYHGTRTFILPSVTDRYGAQNKPDKNYIIKPVSLMGVSDEIGF